MTKNYQYFSIPFDQVPAAQALPCTMWYATWSTTPPVLEPGALPPLVMGATEYAPPPGATVLGSFSKDPAPPPPPPVVGLPEYQRSVIQWLELSRNADE